MNFYTVNYQTFKFYAIALPNNEIRHFIIKDIKNDFSGERIQSVYEKSLR